VPYVISSDFAYTDVPDFTHGDVTFADSGPTVGIVLLPAFPAGPPNPVAGVQGLQVRKTAFYEFGFIIRGADISIPFIPNATPNPLIFELRVNGAPKPQTRFKSGTPATAGAATGERVMLGGDGIISLNAGDVVTLRNITNAVTPGPTGDSVSLGAPGGDDAAVNATLYLIEIPPSLPSP
jgi:hypothetical protein